MRTRIAVGLVIAATVIMGCAGTAWRRARHEDTIVGYHRFLKEFPQSRFSEEARARLELIRVRKNPTRAAFEAYQAKYDKPELLTELKPFVEESYFRYTKAIGTLESYRDFLGDFPEGAYADRARGNLVYLENDAFGEDADALAAFANEHPESDFAEEAQRTVRAIQSRNATSFDQIGLWIDVKADTPGAERVERVFRDRAVAAYSAAGIRVAPIPDLGVARAMGLKAVLRIQHGEGEESTRLEGGHVTRPGIVARTQITMERVEDSAAIWSDSFEFRAPISARRDDVSILFGPGSLSSYWAEIDGQFFIPIARWSTQLAAREPHVFSKPPVALDMAGNRAVALFGDGDFQLIGLGDPAEPELLGEYRRERDLSTFSGVTVHGQRVAVFGSDGVELVALDGENTRRELAFGRETVGSVVALEFVGGAWLAASNRGLLRLDAPGQVRILVARPILGMDRSGDRIVFTDGVSLFVTTLPLLERGRVESELRLGRGFNPGRVRATEKVGVVLGERDAALIDLRSSLLRVRSRISGTESGRVRDAAVIGDRLFLLGSRGLQVVDSDGEHIIDSVDVLARTRLDVSGRHLVMIGEKSLQVVDATPFIASMAASSAH